MAASSLAVVGTGASWLTNSNEAVALTEPVNVLSGPVPSRAQQLAKLKESSVDKPYDVLIIGGGGTGTGTALDATTRGLRTALVERGDFACGTSSKSTKLVHGGVRYLEKAVMGFDMGQLKLVYEALHERKRLLDNASHLASPLAILTPCYQWWEVPYFWAGMKAYDLVAGFTNLIPSKFVTAAETVSYMPTLAETLRGKTLKGAIMYYDGQFDDARLAVALACSASAAGAAVANYTECISLTKDAKGQVIGARVRDVMTKEEVDIFAKVVINATGPYTDKIRKLADEKSTTSVEASSGAHVTLPAYMGSSFAGLIIPKTADGRVVFMLPWQNHMIAGTTDHSCPVIDHPSSTKDDVDYILKTVSEYLGVPVSTSDVTSAWSGLRPLPSKPAAKDTASIVRDHVIFMDDDGLLNVTGGKWTTYRRMAEETVDTAIATGRLPKSKACMTANLPLLGATNYKRTQFNEMAQVAQKSLGKEGANPANVVALVPKLGMNVLKHLCDAYGDHANGVLSMAHELSQGNLLVSGHPYLEAEVTYCCRHEYCCTTEDFLARRSRLAFLDVRACRAAVPRVAALMKQELGWTKAQEDAQVLAGYHFLDTTFTAL